MFLRSHKTHTDSSRGLTLAEMLVAMAVLGILVAGLGSMVTTVHESNDFVQREGNALQHARVAIERMERTCRGAYATADYPGFWVVSQTSGSYSFPDALVVWNPEGGEPANADGPPLLSELVVYTFDAENPETLVEITAPSAVGNAPAISNTTLWQTIIALAKASDAVEKIELTDLLRVANAGVGDADWRGVIRFDIRYHPTINEWTSYQASSITWDEMTWPLDRYGNDYGVRQSWCAIELQLVPDGETRRGAESEENAIAFFGSATLNTTLEP